MKEYIRPEITVKEYTVSVDIASLTEYYYKADEKKNITVSLFAASTSDL